MSSERIDFSNFPTSSIRGVTRVASVTWATCKLGDRNSGSNITISKSKTDPNSKFPDFVAQPSLAQLIAHRITSKHKLAVLVNNKLAFQYLPSWHTPSDDVLPNCHRINSEESGGEV